MKIMNGTWVEFEGSPEDCLAEVNRELENYYSIVPATWDSSAEIRRYEQLREELWKKKVTNPCTT
jgi:hypothetical protein